MEELSINWLVVALHTQNRCFGGVNSVVLIIGPITANSASSITSVSSTAATVAVDGVDFVLHLCQTLPAFWPLVTFLATVGTLAFKLGWSVLVRRGVLRFALALGLDLGLIKLPLLRCVAGTSAHEASTASTSIGVALALA